MPAVMRKPLYDPSQHPYPRRLYRPGETVGVTVNSEEEERAFKATIEAEKAPKAKPESKAEKKKDPAE